MATSHVWKANYGLLGGGILPQDSECLVAGLSFESLHGSACANLFFYPPGALNAAQGLL